MHVSYNEYILVVDDASLNPSTHSLITKKIEMKINIAIITYRKTNDVIFLFKICLFVFSLKVS